jgi:hypothetical protein
MEAMHNDSLNAKLDTFRRKEAAENVAVEKEAAEEDDDDVEDR